MKERFFERLGESLYNLSQLQNVLRVKVEPDAVWLGAPQSRKIILERCAAKERCYERLGESLYCRARRCLAQRFEKLGGNIVTLRSK